MRYYKRLIPLQDNTLDASGREGWLGMFTMIYEVTTFHVTRLLLYFQEVSVLFSG